MVPGLGMPSPVRRGRLPLPPGGAGSGAGAATPARPPAPAVLDDEDGSDLITGGRGGGEQAPSPILDVLTSLQDGGPGRV